jgi:hypothetical protein
MRKTLTVVALAIIGAVITITLVMGGGRVANATPAPKPHCTETDGMCDVVVYLYPRPHKPTIIETCYLSRLPAPEGQGVSFGAYTCKRS